MSTLMEILCVSENEIIENKIVEKNLLLLGRLLLVSFEFLIII